MRLSTLVGIGVLAVSTAALAQVAGAPVEQKVPAAGQTAPGDEVAAPNPAPSGIATPAADTADTAAATPSDDATPAAAPVEQKTTPRRRRR